MKHAVVFFFLLFSSGVRAQISSGNYCIGDLSLLGYTECLEFRQGNLFSYNYHCGDCGRIVGSGNYSIVNDTLKLHFASTCLIEKTTAEVKQDDDSLFFCFRIKSPDSLELESLFISIGIISKENTLVTILSPDAMHCYRFGIKKEQAQEFRLHISCYDYNQESILLKDIPPSCDISLVKGENTVPAGEEFIYKIDFIGKNKLALIPVQTRFTSPGEKTTGKQRPTVYYR